MKTRMIEEKKERKQDQRIDNAHAIEDLLKSEGWKLIAKRLSELRDEAHYQVMVVDCESKTWKAKMNAYDEALDIPNEILKSGRIAKMENV